MARTKSKKSQQISSSHSKIEGRLSGSQCANFCCFIIILSLLAALPLLLLHRNTNEKQDLTEISASIAKLEKEHKNLMQMIATLEREAQRGEQQHAPGAPKMSNIPGFSTALHTLGQDHDLNMKVVPPMAVAGAGPLHTAGSAEMPVAAVGGAAGAGTEAPEPITFNTPSSAESQSVLVVGGTDGSGTRRVVQILTQLGVTMVSEDPETYDIHADAVGGWPPVVGPIIEQTKTLAYDPSMLPQPLQAKMKDALGKLLEIAEGDSVKPTSYVLAKGGALPRPKGISVSRIKYGFKAPVAMALAPYWAYMLPHFRLLHVLRDGRDIAFSANQGPVQKFYAYMYGFKNERDEVKAIRLWSDWNAQLKQWAQGRVGGFGGVSGSDSKKSFGYFAIHSEDLVDESKDVRFAAIAQLAKWVGSDISDKELCCLAMRGSQFMGSHDRTEKNGVGANVLTKRYGKWRQLVGRDVDLKTKLESVGKQGLEEFGYEPMRRLPGSGAEVGGRTCTLSPEACGIVVAEAAAKEKENAASWGIEGVCSVRGGVDYKGGDIDNLSIAGQGVGAGTVDKTLCCQRCRSSAGCQHFTIDVQQGVCYLKHSKGVETKIDDWGKHLVSGDMLI